MVSSSAWGRSQGLRPLRPSRKARRWALQVRPTAVTKAVLVSASGCIDADISSGFSHHASKKLRRRRQTWCRLQAQLSSRWRAASQCWSRREGRRRHGREHADRERVAGPTAPVLVRIRPCEENGVIKTKTDHKECGQNMQHRQLLAEQRRALPWSRSGKVPGPGGSWRSREAGSERPAAAAR